METDTCLFVRISCTLLYSNGVLSIVEPIKYNMELIQNCWLLQFDLQANHMEGDKEEDLQRKTEVLDEENVCAWREVNMDVDRICLSPRAMLLPTRMLAQETHMDM